MGGRLIQSVGIALLGLCIAGASSQAPGILALALGCALLTPWPWLALAALFTVNPRNPKQ